MQLQDRPLTHSSLFNFRPNQLQFIVVNWYWSILSSEPFGFPLSVSFH